MLHYNPLTGIFTWTNSPSNCVKNGTMCTSITDKGYIRIGAKGRGYLAHRLAFLYMTGSFPKNQADHINHIRDDNRWCNLRDVTNMENQQNRTLQSNNTSGVDGVNWHSKQRMWNTRITVNGKRIHIGCFNTSEEAIRAKKHAEKLYGFHANHGKLSV